MTQSGVLFVFGIHSDVSGGLAATYEQATEAVSATQTEVPIGGGSRIGVLYRQVSNTSIYELTYHVGNVRATFRRDATLEEWAVYDAWGTPLEGRRQVSTLTYRYAYQGQEREQVGAVSSTAFELRAWDARIGRWTAPDPYGQYFSAYVGMGNNPVSMIDPDGGWAGGPGGIRTVMGDWLGNSVKLGSKAAKGTSIAGNVTQAIGSVSNGLGSVTRTSSAMGSILEQQPLRNWTIRARATLTFDSSVNPGTPAPGGGFNTTLNINSATIGSGRQTINDWIRNQTDVHGSNTQFQVDLADMRLGGAPGGMSWSILGSNGSGGTGAPFSISQPIWHVTPPASAAPFYVNRDILGPRTARFTNSTYQFQISTGQYFGALNVNWQTGSITVNSAAAVYGRVELHFNILMRTP